MGVLAADVIQSPFKPADSLAGNLFLDARALPSGSAKMNPWRLNPRELDRSRTFPMS
jgi:hypothetical protein